MCFSAVCGCVRVCDTSLEPSRHPHERTPDACAPAAAARPQMAKMCFLLHKSAPNGRFHTYTVRKSYRGCQTNDFVEIQIPRARCAPAMRANVILLHKAAHIISIGTSDAEREPSNARRDETIVKMHFYNLLLNVERKVSEANLSRVYINLCSSICIWLTPLFPSLAYVV